MCFVIATKNHKKLAELRRILNGLGIEAIGESELDRPLDPVEETGSTFEENAALKAVSACRQTGLPAVADDSGLCVTALNGAPGVYSARYAAAFGRYAASMGENSSDMANMDKLLRELRGQSDRSAAFVCVICCALPDGRKLFVRGECPGEIAEEPGGSGGFGYDPVFVYDGIRFSEMDAGEKDAVSHRGQALRELSRRLPDFIRKDDAQ